MVVSIGDDSNKVTLHFNLSWAQRQFLCFLSERGRRTTLNPEGDMVKPHWDQIESLAKQGIITIVDIVGSTIRKEISLTDIGAGLVDMIKDQIKKQGGLFQ